jgi:hypothetical protein
LEDLRLAWNLQGVSDTILKDLERYALRLRNLDVRGDWNLTALGVIGFVLARKRVIVRVPPLEGLADWKKASQHSTSLVNCIQIEDGEPDSF